MTLDPAQMKHGLVRMLVTCTVLTMAAVGFAVAYFMYDVAWAIWAFVGLLAVSFGVQIWFVRGFARMNRGK